MRRHSALLAEAFLTGSQTRGVAAAAASASWGAGAGRGRGLDASSSYYPITRPGEQGPGVVGRGHGDASTSTTGGAGAGGGGVVAGTPGGGEEAAGERRFPSLW